MATKPRSNLGPNGLDAALQLLDLVNDADKYTKMLSNVQANVEEANRMWENVAIAGDIHKLLDEAKTKLDALAEDRRVLEEKAKDKEIKHDRQHSQRMAAIKKKENDFYEYENNAKDRLVARDKELNEREASLKSLKDSTLAAEEKLRAERAKIDDERKSLEKRSARIMEVIHG